jgi:metal-responsive CopG/Arc/MetJ family transcriptional regulator
VKLIIRPKKGLGKIEVELPDKLVEEINRLSERYAVDEKRVLEIIISKSFREPKGNVEVLENEVRELEKKVAKLEKEWAPLRYKAYGVSEDNKLLAIELNALLAENSQLKRFLGKKIERNLELRKLIQYYLR